MYMYCNEKILQRIESEEYEQDMPRWMYDCNDSEDEPYDVGPTSCTIMEVVQKTLKLMLRTLKKLLTRLLDACKK